MDVLKPDDIKERFKGKFWVSPYKKIVATTDEKVVELIEDHARGTCYGGAAWEVHHYPRTSSLIYYSKRDGARNIFRARVGETDLELVPGLAAAGIEKVKVSNSKIRIQYTAAVVLPRYEKGVFGIDDTDSPTSGATWALANEIGHQIGARKKIHYTGHCINQLFPQNPHKTQNCVSIAISFAVVPNERARLIKEVKRLLIEHSESDETGLAVHTGIEVPDAVKRYARMAKMRMVEIEDARLAAKKWGIELSEITGERGLIGALAAIGFYDDPDAAVRVDV